MLVQTTSFRMNYSIPKGNTECVGYRDNTPCCVFATAGIQGRDGRGGRARRAHRAQHSLGGKR